MNYKNKLFSWSLACCVSHFSNAETDVFTRSPLFCTHVHLLVCPVICWTLSLTADFALKELIIIFVCPPGSSSLPLSHASETCACARITRSHLMRSITVIAAGQVLLAPRHKR